MADLFFNTFQLEKLKSLKKQPPKTERILGIRMHTNEVWPQTVCVCLASAQSYTFIKCRSSQRGPSPSASQAVSQSDCKPEAPCFLFVVVVMNVAAANVRQQSESREPVCVQLCGGHRQCSRACGPAIWPSGQGAADRCNFCTQQNLLRLLL